LEDLNERCLVDVERAEDERRSLMIKLTSEGRRLLEELRRLRKILEDYGLA
jgi:DNA-binding MarR family transcriptional regulator